MNSARTYRFFTWTTLIGLLVVVIAGGLVKATDSGMGCPDWPKCFGHLVPPLDESEVQWHSSNEYFEGQMILHDGKLWTANTLFTSGTNFDAANWQQFDDHHYAEYKPIHTLIEYVNRLATVLLGFLALGMLIFAFLQKEHKALHRTLSILTVVLIGYEAWLGRQVVDSVLAAEKISKHLYAAFLLVFIAAIVAVYTRKKGILPQVKKVKILLITSLCLLSIQLFLGTQLREIFDEFHKEMSLQRNYWIDNAGVEFLVHRSFSLVYLSVIVTVFFKVKGQFKEDRILRNVLFTIAGFVVLEILSGVVMAYFEVPRAMQPTHVFLSASLLAANTYAVFYYSRLKPDQ